MKFNLSLAAVILTACTATTLPEAPQRRAAEGPRAAAITNTRTILAPMLREYPAISVAVAVNGETVLSEAHGWADVPSKREATPSTVFRIYSTSKPVTAALAMRLSERKRVDLDAPVRQYLPDLPPAVSGVTLRQLLAHRGGIRHYRDGEWLSVSRSRCTAARDALAPFIGDALVAAPDTTYRYSSFGYVLASAVLEAATKRPFYDLLRDEVFAPAGVKTMAVEHAVDPSALATPYEKDLSKAVSADNSCKFGAGGLVATSEDLARFGVALSEGRLVSEQSLKEMFAGRPTEPERPDYGLGFVLASDPVLGPLAMHSGGALGGRSFLLIAREHRVVVALAGNVEGKSLQSAAIEIAKAFLK